VAEGLVAGAFGSLGETASSSAEEPKSSSGSSVLSRPRLPFRFRFSIMAASHAEIPMPFVAPRRSLQGPRQGRYPKGAEKRELQ
jgi:hypothetical protein